MLISEFKTLHLGIKCFTCILCFQNTLLIKICFQQKINWEKINTSSMIKLVLIYQKNYIPHDFKNSSIFCLCDCIRNRCCMRRYKRYKMNTGIQNKKLYTCIEKSMVKLLYHFFSPDCHKPASFTIFLGLQAYSFCISMITNLCWSAIHKCMGVSSRCCIL